MRSKPPPDVSSQSRLMAKSKCPIRPGLGDDRVQRTNQEKDVGVG